MQLMIKRYIILISINYFISVAGFKCDCPMFSEFWFVFGRFRVGLLQFLHFLSVTLNDLGCVTRIGDAPVSLATTLVA